MQERVFLCVELSIEGIEIEGRRRSHDDNGTKETVICKGKKGQSFARERIMMIKKAGL